MKVIRTILKPFQSTNSRFNRYYAGVVGQGAGYPTADEARRDMRSVSQPMIEGWFR